MKKTTASEIIKHISKKFHKNIYNSAIYEKKIAVKSIKTKEFWVYVDVSAFHEVVSEICNINYPFLSVISGRDSKEGIVLIYHLFVKQNHTFTQGKQIKSKKSAEECINLCVKLPKNKPRITSITDLIPGAKISELEKQEMLGVDIIGIPNEKVFLPINHPKGFYPWRKK